MASKASSTKTSGDIVGYILVLIIIAVGAALYYVYRTQQTAPVSAPQNQVSQTLESEPTPIPSPTRTPPKVWHGKGTFTVSTRQSGPQFSTGTLDPYDPPVGGRQTISLSLNDTKPITKVTVVVQTDNKKNGPMTLSRVSGSDTTGVWQTTWTFDDSYNLNYVMTFTAQSENGTSTITNVIR